LSIKLSSSAEHSLVAKAQFGHVQPDPAAVRWSSEQGSPSPEIR